MLREILYCIELYAESFSEPVIGLWLFETLRDNLKSELIEKKT